MKIDIKDSKPKISISNELATSIRRSWHNSVNQPVATRQENEGDKFFNFKLLWIVIVKFG